MQSGAPGPENAGADERVTYGSSWYSATTVAARQRGQLSFDLDVDVCVIGAGLAGLTTAHEIARRGWSVALLEARRIAWNASGRNDGFVLPGFAESMDNIIARVGFEHGKALWDLSQMGLRYVRNMIADQRMPGVAPVPGWLKVSKIYNGDQILADMRLYRDELETEVEAWPTERVRDALKSLHYFDALHWPSAFHIHPLNYALGLAEAAEKAGARIFENTPAVSVDAGGVRKRITTPLARVRSGYVVLACNVHLGSLLPRVSGTLIPIWSYVLVTKPLGATLSNAVTYEGAVTDTDLADNHYRIIDGDRLLWSGRSTTWERDAWRYAKDLVSDIAEIYPQLGPVEAEFAWSGVLGNALHRMPQIGELSPGLWLASGFGGHGLNTTAMAGNIVAQAIVEGDDSWRLFSPFELVWAGGAVGRAVQQVYYWWFHGRERFLARQAREREGEFRRAEDLAVLRTGAEQEKIEAKIGAVVPADQLPKEPVLAELPHDPLSVDPAGEQSIPSGEDQAATVDEPPARANAEPRGQRGTAGAEPRWDVT